MWHHHYIGRLFTRADFRVKSLPMGRYPLIWRSRIPMVAITHMATERSELSPSVSGLDWLGLWGAEIT